MRSLGKLVRWMVLLGVAFAAGYLSRGGDEEVKLHVAQSISPGQAQRGQGDGLYVCPMMHVAPTQRPGRCPVCGMDMVRISGGALQEGVIATVRLTKEAAKLAQVQVKAVQRRAVQQEIRLYGQIDYDPAHLSYVSAYMPGVVNRVYVERAGVSVRWGQPLLDFYSSELYATEQQLFEAAQVVPGLLAFREGTPHVARKGDVESRGARDEAVRQEALKKMAAIRHKLRILGLSKRDIDELQQRAEPTGIATLTAPRAGVVIRQNATEGLYVNTGTVLLVIADPKYIWLRLDAYEADLPWIKNGQEVEFQVEAFPGERFVGRVTYIDPIFNPKSRTTTVGVMVPDTGRLRPEMIARAVLHSELGTQPNASMPGQIIARPPLAIPASAALITGKRALVYVAVTGQEWTYEAREVVLGPRGRDYLVVKEGLEEGELVVTNGAFKIDSASQILAKPSMMNNLLQEALKPRHK
ncbi:MAG: efflux RND transporter periplasmic adaptor subunit [Thermodesulfobacteriota bacterium]